MTGCTVSTSSANLYNESKLETLEQRRNKHSLVLFYKIANNLTGARLRELLPQQVCERTAYNLRNRDNYTINYTRTSSHYNSFFPSAVRQWNDLNLDVRNSASLSAFKNKLNVGVCKVSPYYCTGKRKNVINHTRLRNNCSALNGDLYRNYVKESPICSCGGEDETATHYLFHCANYLQQRAMLEQDLQQFNIDTNILLKGNDCLTDDENTLIFKAVHGYIERTKRFYPP